MIFGSGTYGSKEYAGNLIPLIVGVVVCASAGEACQATSELKFTATCQTTSAGESCISSATIPAVDEGALAGYAIQKRRVKKVRANVATESAAQETIGRASLSFIGKTKTRSSKEKSKAQSILSHIAAIQAKSSAEYINAQGGLRFEGKISSSSNGSTAQAISEQSFQAKTNTELQSKARSQSELVFGGNVDNASGVSTVLAQGKVINPIIVEAHTANPASSSESNSRVRYKYRGQINIDETVEQISIREEEELALLMSLL